MQWIIVASASAVAALVVLVLLWLFIRKKRCFTPRQSLSADQVEQTQRDLLEIKDELEQLVSRIDIQVEQRVRELKKLLARVDGKIELLRGMESSAQLMTKEKSGCDQSLIIKLSRQGLDSLEIARRMEMTVGEVELIINLQRGSKEQLRT